MISTNNGKIHKGAKKANFSSSRVSPFFVKSENTKVGFEVLTAVSTKMVVFW
jgi:hypothetical protein